MWENLCFSLLCVFIQNINTSTHTRIITAISNAETINTHIYRDKRDLPDDWNFWLHFTPVTLRPLFKVIMFLLYQKHILIYGLFQQQPFDESAFCSRLSLKWFSLFLLESTFPEWDSNCTPTHEGFTGNYIVRIMWKTAFDQRYHVGRRCFLRSSLLKQ